MDEQYFFFIFINIFIIFHWWIHQQKIIARNESEFMYIQGRKWFIFLIPHSTIVSFLNQYPKWKFQYWPLLFLVLCIYHGTYIIDGNSELGKHVRGNTCYLICSRHSIRLRAVTNRFLSMRADHCSELPFHVYTKVHILLYIQKYDAAKAIYCVCG